MAASTGPILAAGGITLFTRTVVQGHLIPQEYRVIAGTALAAGGLALLEKANAGLAIGLSWLTLITVLLVRVDPKTPSPVEAFNTWFNAK